jgi:hypothetical protein
VPGGAKKLPHGAKNKQIRVAPGTSHGFCSKEKRNNQNGERRNQSGPALIAGPFSFQLRCRPKEQQTPAALYAFQKAEIEKWWWPG